MNLTQAAYSTLIPIALVLAHRDLYAVVYWNVVADLALTLALVVFIGAWYGFGAPDWRRLAGFLKFGIPLLPAGYAMWVLNSSDRVFLTHYRTLHDVGIYSVAYNLGYVLIALIANPIWVMFPGQAAALYNNHRFDELRHLFDAATKATLLLLVPATVGLAVLARPIMLMLATEEFAHAAILAPVVTVGYACATFGAYFDLHLALAGRQIWTTVIYVLAAVVNLAANWILIPHYGIFGAALSTVLAFALAMTLSWIMASQSFVLRISPRFLMRVTAASLVMAVVVACLPGRVGTAGLVIRAIVGVIVFGSSVLALRVFDPVELTAAFRLVGLSAFSRSRMGRFVIGGQVH